MKLEENAYFKTGEVLSLLEITRAELYTIMRPVRSGGKLLPAIFCPETQTKLSAHWIFTQRDIIKLKRYFRALKEFKAAKEDLRKTGKPPNMDWVREE